MKSFLYTVDTMKSFETAVRAVERKVAEKGFRVVHTYDVAATLADAGCRRGPLKIIEVCNALRQRGLGEGHQRSPHVALSHRDLQGGWENSYRYDAPFRFGCVLSPLPSGRNCH
jgi:hypothetical protein